ncbi:Uncharacterized conserved protein [Janthinobacterium sp. Marseille]|nr:Uncharacterized conserved protein [Janthinobacterium sp. Marseille]
MVKDGLECNSSLAMRLSTARLTNEDIKMKCPACNEMHLITSDRHGIEIDYCPNCRGVWLDRGELDKLIDRSANALPPEAPPLPRYRGERTSPVRTVQHGYNKEGYGQKRKKDLIGELFDF